MSAQQPDANGSVGAIPETGQSSTVGGRPTTVIQAAAERIAPNTAITSTNIPPGDTEHSVKANVAFPAASLANPNAANAGARIAGQPEELQPSAPHKVEKQQAQGSSQPVASPQPPYQQTQQPPTAAQDPQASAEKTPKSAAPAQSPPTSNGAPSLANSKVCVLHYQLLI